MKRSKPLIYLIQTMSLFCLFSCNYDPKPTTTSNSTIVFRDDFSDNKYNWFEKNNDTIYCAIKNDSLTLYNKGKYYGWKVWQNIQIDTNSNWSAKASFTWRSGSYDYGYGFVWGIKDSLNLNYFVVNANRAYTIGFDRNGTYNSVKNWAYYYPITSTTNTLEIRKEGSQTNYIVNDKVAYTSKNLPLLGEGIGIYVSNIMKVSVDYIEITQR